MLIYHILWVCAEANLMDKTTSIQRVLEPATHNCSVMIVLHLECPIFRCGPPQSFSK